MRIYLILFAIVIVVISSRTEAFQAVLPDKVGGTVLSKMTIPDTVVRKLLGNTDQTIILIHNSPFNYEVWSSLYMYTQSLLRQGMQIPTLISYDLKGHGTAWQPVKPDVEWTFKEFSDDLYAIYKEYVPSGKKVTIAGYGFGGSVAQDFALTYPETVEHLFILQATINVVTAAVDREIVYLSRWITNNPQVSYLTMDRSFVQYNMCIWFNVNDNLICPYPENAKDHDNSYGTTEYLLADKLFREGSASTLLHVDKLYENSNFRDRWEKITVDFPITLLTADRDHYSVGFKPSEEIKIVKKASHNTKLYIVDGKHGFTLIHTEYIFNLLVGKDMSKDPLTL